MNKRDKKCVGFWNTLSIFLAVSGCFWFSWFASLVCAPASMTSSVGELKICAITVGIKNYKSITKKKRKKHN